MYRKNCLKRIQHCCADIIGIQGLLLLAYGLDDRSQFLEREGDFPF